MLCTKCGAENPNDSKFCNACGNPLSTVAEEPEIPVVEVAADAIDDSPAEAPAEVSPAAAEAPKSHILVTVKEKMAPLLGKVKPFISKNKLLLIGSSALVLLALSVAIIIGLCTSGNGFIAFENAILCDVLDDEVVVAWNNKLINTDIEASGVDEPVYNLDGTVCAVLTSDNTLLAIHNKKVKIVSEDVLTFELSSDGMGIAYITGDNDEADLKLYNVRKNKSVLVEDEVNLFAAAFLGMALSPDGKTLAYYEMDEDDEEPTLMLYTNKKSIKITSTLVSLIGLSNGGKQIYVIGENDDGDEVLYTYNKRGDREKISSCSSSSFFFNADHTQILFYNNGKSYISVKGKEPNKISSNSAHLLISDNSVTMSNHRGGTYPVEDLYNHVYMVSDDGETQLWNIKKNANRSAKLASDAYSITLDADAAYVYYINDEGDLKMLKISHGENASNKAKTIAEDVENYVITSNRKKVYFISDNGLYSCNAANGKGKKTIANEDVGRNLAINAKNVVYYMLDGDVYACSNGRKGSKVLSDSDDFRAFPNGTVYAIDDDGDLYVSTGAKKFKQLHDAD